MEKEQSKTKEALALAIKNELQARFDRIYSRSREETPVAMLGSAQLLFRAVALKDRSVADSILLHLGAWSQDVHPLRASCSHQGVVMAVAFSPDGKTVLTGSDDQTARLWDTATGKPFGPPLQHQGGVRTVAFSPDGETIATGGSDMARLWKTATGKQVGPSLHHNGIVYAVAFSPDGETLLTGSAADNFRKGEVTLWETATGKQLGPSLKHQAVVDRVAFSPNGKIVLTADYLNVRLWETATLKQIGLPLQHGGTITAVAFSPDSKTVATGSVHNTARLWETPSVPTARH